MESASLGLPSNELENILNVNHVLKFVNYIKKKGEGGGQEGETRPDRSRSHFPTFEIFVYATGFYVQTN